MTRAIGLLLLLAGCASAPVPQGSHPAPDIVAVPGKAVIYVMREGGDMSRWPASIWLGDTMTITTYAGTHARWETTPGRKQIAGFAADNGVINIDAVAGQVYFVQQLTHPGRTQAYSVFRLIDRKSAEAILAHSEPLPL